MSKGHCLDYWHKWKKEYNFCGLRPQDAKQNDKYLSLIDKIASSSTGIEGDFALEHFTAGAARPLLRCKDDDIATKALNYIIACLKRGETITGGDLGATIQGFTRKVGPVKSTQLRTSAPAPAPELVKEPVKEESVKSLGERLKEDTVIPPQTPSNSTGLNPAPITDTYIKVSPNSDNPFKTAAQIKGGIAGEMFPASKDPKEEARIKKERRDDLAAQLLELMPKSTQLAVSDHMRDHPSQTVSDVFYFSIEALQGVKK